MGKLANKVAVITGASKGIGAAVAKALAAEGASVIVNYASSKAGADSVVESILADGGKAIAVAGDVSKAAEAGEIIKAAITHFGRLDILVNNAGVYEFSPLAAITEDRYRRMFDINVLGLILMTQAAAEHLREGSSVINIGSNITSMKPPSSALYAASKGAVDTITGVLAKELGPKKIRVNSINPGPTATEGTENFMSSDSDMGRVMIAQTPLGRLGRPEDVASVAVFLASDDSGWITGDILQASGGL